MKEFKVNEYITLKLKAGETNIYVNNELFKQCKTLLLNIPIEEFVYLDEINSVDQVAENLGWSEEGQMGIKDKSFITPETEFWAHCSNIQIWAEYNYNTQLLHSSLAFPLLKKLVEAGNLLAKKVFKEEIAKRLVSNHLSVVLYLLEEKYFDYLDAEELSSVLRDSEIIKILLKDVNIEYDDLNNYIKMFHVKAPLGLKQIFFDEDNKLRKFIGEFLEEFPHTRYHTLEILYNLYKKDETLREALVEGIVKIFREGSFFLIFDMVILLKEGSEILESIVEYAWNSEFFTRESPFIQHILKRLEENDIYTKKRCVDALTVIWRYMEYGLSEKVIESILKDEENKIDLLLRLVLVWYEGSLVLNSDSIEQLERLGNNAIKELKVLLKGKSSKVGFYMSVDLDKLTFIPDLQDTWPDFNYTLTIIYKYFGAKKLIEYLDGFDYISHLIYIDENNYPGPLYLLGEAFVKCSESRDDILINRAKHVFNKLNEILKERIVQSITGDFLDENLIEYIVKQKDFESLRFLLNFGLLSELDKKFLFGSSKFNFLEIIIESLKEIDHYPSEIFDDFIKIAINEVPNDVINCIQRLESAEQKEILTYLNQIRDSSSKK